MKKLVSVVVPVFNEQDNLREFHAAIVPVFESLAHHYVFELIFVDDGSKDISWALITQLTENNSYIRGIKLSRNFGHQIALSAGYAHALGSAIISMDADLQDPPSLIPALLEEWEKGSPVVYARRADRKDPWLKKATAALFYSILERISPIRIPQSVGDFRLIDRQVLTILLQLKEQTKFLRGLVAWCGFKHAFVDFKRPARLRGESGYTWKKMFRLAFDGIIAFSNVLIKLPAFVGTGIIIGSLGLYITHTITAPIMLLSCIMGVQCLFLWLLAEYISRMLDQVRSRPLYVIQTQTAELLPHEAMKITVPQKENHAESSRT
jgi:polyisoprenyl-phosphate glycosyltransferase